MTSPTGLRCLCEHSFTTGARHLQRLLTENERQAYEYSTNYSSDPSHGHAIARAQVLGLADKDMEARSKVAKLRMSKKAGIQS